MRQIVVNGRDGDVAVLHGPKIGSRHQFPAGVDACQPIINILPGIDSLLVPLHNDPVFLPGQERPLDLILRQTRDIDIQADALRQRQTEDLQGQPGGKPGCGAPGRTVTFTINGQTMAASVAWDIDRVIYLPLHTGSYSAAPDLIVQSLQVSGVNVQVVLKNQGVAPVADEFWVDFYVNPNPAPAGVNQIWNDGRSAQGIVWGITNSALPLLLPGGIRTTTSS